MSKTFRPYNPEQAELLPQSPRDWLSEDHLAYFILDVMKELDLGSIFAHYERETRGQPPHHPRMMVALLLYGYSVGVASSRKLEKKTYEDLAFRVLTGGQQPDHVRISEFRRIHAEALAGLFTQVLALCQKAGLVQLGHVALDGTKVKANASKHKAMSYERMQKREEEYQEKAEALLRVAEETDTAEDNLYGKDKRGDELPEELRRTESRLQRIRAAKKALEAEAKAAREATKAGADEATEEQTKRGAAPEASRSAENEVAKEQPEAQVVAKVIEAARPELAEERAESQAAPRTIAAAEHRASEAMEPNTSEVSAAGPTNDETEAQGVTKVIEAARPDIVEERVETQAAPRTIETAEHGVSEATEPKTSEASAAGLTNDGNDEPPPSAGPTPLPQHKIRSNPDGTPHPKAQRNFTDPDNRIMKNQDGFVQAYNCQAAVDEKSQIIVAQAVTNQPPDVEHLVPVVEQMIENCGDVPQQLTADAGYFSEENVVRAAELGVETFIATKRQKHGEPQQQPQEGPSDDPSPGPRGAGQPGGTQQPQEGPSDGSPEERIKEWMARKLATEDGAAVYARRKAVVEPVFGQIKAGRGFRQFLRRGIEKVRAEWALICTTHNLLKLYQAA